MLPTASSVRIRRRPRLNAALALFALCLGCDPAGPELAIATTDIPIGFVGRAYTGSFRAPGQIAGARWTLVSGGVPGLTLTRAGQLTGVPTQTGEFTIVVRGRSGDSSGVREVTIKIFEPFEILPEVLPHAIVGVDYQVQLRWQGGASDGNHGGIVVENGSLPPGLFIERPLAIHPPFYLKGKAQVIGTSTFTLHATRGYPPDTASRTYTIVVASFASSQRASAPLTTR